jgi:hypothetical protein
MWNNAGATTLRFRKQGLIQDAGRRSVYERPIADLSAADRSAIGRSYGHTLVYSVQRQICIVYIALYFLIVGELSYQRVCGAFH